MDCQGLHKHKKILKKFPQQYICKNCTHPKGHFDYHSSQLRLQEAEKLDSACKLENLFLRDEPTSESEEVEVIDGKKEDDISKNIIREYGKNISL